MTLASGTTTRASIAVEDRMFRALAVLRVAVLLYAALLLGYG